MILTLILLGALVAVLLLGLARAFRSPKGPAAGSLAWSVESVSRAHVEFLPQIRQALARQDDEFLSRAGANLLRKRVKKERRRVALAYLKALRADFEGLLRMAKIIAALSPKLRVGHEVERVRLTVTFLWRYRLAQLSLYVGQGSLEKMAALSNFMSGFSVRLEAGLKAMGERAALAAEMISPSDRSGIHLT